MSVNVGNDKKKFVDAVKNNESKIVIEGSLADGVYKIHIVGKLAWAVAGAALGAAIYMYLATPAATVTTGGVGGTISFGGATAVAGGAVAVLGFSATSIAIGIGVVAGGVGVLHSIRNKYRIIERSGKRLVLERK
ncbi:MAG: hypothetical protein HQL81_10240 [Magnetococcales bacterium]|nr:hypothetical protein [Magnetococcales bacterium]